MTPHPDQSKFYIGHASVSHHVLPVLLAHEERILPRDLPYITSAAPAAGARAELVAANKAASHGSPAQPGLPIVTACWDRRPWENPMDPKQETCWYHPDRTPEQFAVSVRDAVAWMDQHPDQG